jgi:hydrogenase maturation protease
MKPCVLVIGYGNELRRDDGIGPCVARAVAAWNHPGLLALAVPQLTPELADDLAFVDRVVFVDAGREGPFAVRSLLPAASGGGGRSHLSDPRGLLALTEALYGHRPTAWLVTVPAADLGLGTGLSDTARQGADEALRQIELLLHNQAGWCQGVVCRGRTDRCPWEEHPLRRPDS